MTTPNDNRFLTMALAYMEIGRVAASAETEFKNNGEYGNAVAYQLFHALELFYKHMIQKKKGSFEHGHDLNKLESDYFELYPDAESKIDHPFDISSYKMDAQNEGEQQLFESHQARFKPKYLDQHLRYPVDERTGGYSFSLSPCVFEDIKEKMLQVHVFTAEH